MRKLVYGLVGLVMVGAIAAITLYFNPKLAQRIFLKPPQGFDLASVPPAPDYNLPDAWAALPDQSDAADVVPTDSDLVDRQADALVDVFFVHPTTYYQNDMWNAHFDEPGETRDFLEQGVLRHQAALFNSS